MPEKNKKKEISTFEWTMWIIGAIIGVSLLLVGINNVAAGDADFTRCVMFIVLGILFLGVTLSYIIGNLNIAVSGEEVAEPKAKKPAAKKTAKK